MSAGALAWYAVSGLVAAAVLAALVALAAAAAGRRAPGPGPLRMLRGAGAAAWVAHYAEVWRPVTWEYAAPRLTAWPGGLAFALAAPALAAAAYALAWRAAPRRPLLAAAVPPLWLLAYRALMIRVLYWRAPEPDFRVDDDPAGMWLFARTAVLAGALLLCAAALLLGRRRPVAGAA